MYCRRLFFPGSFCLRFPSCHFITVLIKATRATPAQYFTLSTPSHLIVPRSLAGLGNINRTCPVKRRQFRFWGPLIVWSRPCIYLDVNQSAEVLRPVPAQWALDPRWFVGGSQSRWDWRCEIWFSLSYWCEEVTSCSLALQAGSRTERETLPHKPLDYYYDYYYSTARAEWLPVRTMVKVTWTWHLVLYTAALTNIHDPIHLCVHI